jgi:hypothetical protein
MKEGIVRGEGMGRFSWGLSPGHLGYGLYGFIM